MMRVNRRYFVAAFLLCACGVQRVSSPTGSEGGGAPSDAGCVSGQVLCAGCNGGSYCAGKCPTTACPVPSGASDANTVNGNSCPSDTPSYCSDCNDGGFCVSGGCPVTTCPVRDAAAGGAPSDASTGDVSALVPCADGGCAAPDYCFILPCGGGAPQPGTPPCTPPPPVCAPLPSDCADGGGMHFCPASPGSSSPAGIYFCPGNVNFDRRQIECKFQ